MPIETQRTRTHQLEDSKEAVISGPANPAADPRQIRRVIAEDPEWNLETVPPLCDLCVSHIVSQFPINPLLDELPPPYRQKVLDKLPTSIPLDVTAPLINEEDYWEKCCNERWALCVVADHNGQWKQMYFERHIQELIEQFVPSLSDLQQLESSLKLASPYVQCIKLNQLLPPPPPQEIKLLDEEEIGDNLSEVDSLRPSRTHLDLGVPLKHLERLQELHLSYGVKNCGMNFDWGLFEFTKEDCQKLATAIKSTHQLKVLSLYRSKLSDDKARLLISYLLDHTSLSTLDLSHNKLSDGSARALSKLLNGHCVLRVLDISNNCIGAMGGASLGHALKVNNTLIELNIKLNRLGDEGAQPILKALMKNTTLQSLNIGSNDFGEPTATILSELLVSNQILTKLNITCNKLGETGGKLLQEGIEENKTLIELDLRLTEISAENEYSINQKIRTNADRVGGVS